MKRISVFLALAFLSANVFAGWIDENSSWEDILRSASHRAEFPKETFRGGSVFVPVWNMCVYTDSTGKEMMDGGTWDECIDYSNDRDHECREYREIRLVKPRVHKDRYCVRWRNVGDGQECEEYRTYTRTIALTYDVPVFDGSTYERAFPEFTKKFTIPSCN